MISSFSKDSSYSRRGIRSRAARAIFASSAAIAITVALATPAYAGDTPTGWFYGSDGAAPGPACTTGSCPPYQEPTVGGLYGGYVGEIGTWTDYLGCTSGAEYSRTFATAANDDVHVDPTEAPGLLLYFYGGGPGADPNYNPSASLDQQLVEAYNWGWDQASYAMSFNSAIGINPAGPTHIVFMDIEPSNGWNSIVKYTSCNRSVTSAVINGAVDRADFNGFWAYIEDDAPGFVPGVYSANDFLPQTFTSQTSPNYPPYSNGQPDDYIPNTWQWAYEPDLTSPSPGPSGDCVGSSCAGWFASVNADREVAWQWSHTGAYGDYDQFDAKLL